MSCPNCIPTPRSPIVLPKAGQLINWFGTIYKVDAVKAPDVVVVTEGNGYKANLWWTGGPGNTIVE